MRIVFIAFFLSLCGCVSQTSAPEDAQSVREKPGMRTAVINSVLVDLRAPQSALFGPINYFRDHDGKLFACGTVNPTNGYGGYVGISPFFSGIVRTDNGIYVAAAVIADVTEKYGVSVFYMNYPKCVG